MEYSKEQKKEIVKCNVDQAKNILVKAQLMNKGMYSHPINKMIHQLSDLLSKKSKYNYDDEEDIFWKIVKLKHSLAGYMFYVDNEI